MVSVGDKLGGRFFVTKVGDRVAPGSYIEVRDALSAVFHAQFLHPGPISAQQLSILEGEIAAVAPEASLVLPDEIVQSPAGETFSIFTAAPLPPLSNELLVYATGGNADRRLAVQRTLLNAFAALADDLGRASGTRSCHNAITLQAITVSRGGENLALALSGFGIEPAARIVAQKDRPPPRTDPSALMIALHDALSRCQALPEGPAQVKWSVVYNCAKGGDHAALASGAALAKFLRDVLLELEGIKVPPPSLRPPDKAQTDRPASITPSPAVSPVPVAKSPTRIDDNRRTVALAGGALVLLAGVGVAVTVMGDESGSTAAQGDPGAPAPRAAGTPLSCGDEPVTPPHTVEHTAPVAGLQAACAGDGTGLNLVLTSASGAAHVERSIRRGQHFGDVAAWLDDVAEAGTELTDGNATWFAWRPASGAAFGIARTGASPATMTVNTSSWTGGAFHGAFLLGASATGAWVASTLDGPAGPSAVAVRLAWGGGEAPMTVYRITQGTIDAVIPGATTSLLVHTSEGTQRRFSVVNVSLGVLPVLATAPTAPAGGDESAAAGPSLREVPEVSLQRSGVYTLDADAVSVARYGVQPANAPRYFLITSGHAEAASSCGPSPCVRNGAVHLVNFPPSGDPSRQVLTEHGRGLDLGLNGNGLPTAVACDNIGCGVFTRIGVDAPQRESLALPALAHAQFVACGGEPWVTFASDAAPARVGALPLACLSRRSAAH